MIPLDLSPSRRRRQKKLHFDIVNHPQLTPLLVALTTFNGLTQNSIYGEGTTLHLSGEIGLKGHAPVQIENTFAPGDSLSPATACPSRSACKTFSIAPFTNTFESPSVDAHLAASRKRSRPPVLHDRQRVARKRRSRARGNSPRSRSAASLSRRRTIEETTRPRSRPDRARHVAPRAGQRRRPAQSRFARFCNSRAAAALRGLDQLIALLNRERRNDRLYVGLFVPSPTILWDDKELPNAPLSQINVDRWPSRSWHRAGFARIAGQRIFHSAGRPGFRRDLLNLQIR